MNQSPDLTHRLVISLNHQQRDVLRTCGGQQPYASLVAFAATDDLSHIVLVTPCPTRKYADLTANGRVALWIDNRPNRMSDLRRAMAARAVGSVREVRKANPSYAVGRARRRTFFCRTAKGL
ncbi:MAG: pyridoxamine 5'-phosphate oxidase family protein [Phycisphaerae bacterium]|nr:pyridoxamine 5'-phosphate oxidase family protein [Phycisphaerae bacterium]